MSEIERAIEKKEYIERGALLKAFGCENAVKYGNKNAEQQHKSYSSMMLYEIADEIYDAPAADVEEVVRCKDCRYADGVYVLDSEPRYILCSKHRICVKPRGYCSYGERKIDGEKEGV